MRSHGPTEGMDGKVFMLDVTTWDLNGQTTTTTTTAASN